MNAAAWIAIGVTLTTMAAILAWRIIAAIGRYLMGSDDGD